ncbi:hypothetical protein DFH09DRAFT_1374117 [Mycena vulgaris]|nr:hypothetical protein DFH09DRAFT_1374117 [Mycena vulgaris]
MGMGRIFLGYSTTSPAETLSVANSYVDTPRTLSSRPQTASKTSQTRAAPVHLETTTDNSCPVVIPTVPSPELLAPHVKMLEDRIRSADGLSDLSIPNVKPDIFVELADKFAADRKFRLEYFRDNEIVTVKWPSNAHEGYKPLINPLIDLAQHDIRFSCETNADSSTELRDRAKMWLTLATVICVITVDFRTKQFLFPQPNPAREMVGLTRVAFGKRATSLLEAITAGGGTWAHPITAIELTLYAQESGARGEGSGVLSWNITPGHADLLRCQTEIDATLRVAFSTAVGADTFDELYPDEDSFLIKWPDLASVSTTQPTAAPPAPKRITASEAQRLFKRSRIA